MEHLSLYVTPYTSITSLVVYNKALIKNKEGRNNFFGSSLGVVPSISGAYVLCMLW